MKTKGYWHELESHGTWSAVDLEQFWPEKTAKAKKNGKHVMGPVQAALLTFSVQLRLELINIEHTLVRFLLPQFEEGNRGVEDFEGLHLVRYVVCF